LKVLFLAAFGDGFFRYEMAISQQSIPFFHIKRGFIGYYQLMDIGS